MVPDFMLFFNQVGSDNLQKVQSSMPSVPPTALKVSGYDGKIGSCGIVHVGEGEKHLNKRQK